MGLTIAMGKVDSVAMDTTAAAMRIRQLVNGYQVSQALHVAATLRLSDHLAAGPRSSSDLAQLTGTDPGSLTRLLHALSTIDVYRRDPDGHWEATELGAALCDDAPGSVGAWARQIGRPYYWQAWSGLLHSVRTGENAFAAVHGQSVWAYRSTRPDEQEVFDQAMTGLSAAATRAVLNAYDFTPHHTVVDVGGGHGGLLAAILTRHSQVRGVLFDQPDVVNAAQPLLAAAGVADRCDHVGGDFFTAAPADGDLYLLKAVLHDWPDPESVAILTTLRRTVPDTATLLVIEQLLDEGPEPARTAFSDLNMLVAPGGRERTRDQYATLLASAGWHLSGVLPTAAHVFVLEAHPVDRGQRRG